MPFCLSNLITIQNENVRSSHTYFYLKPPIRTNTESAKLCIRHSIPNLINSYNRNFVDQIPNMSIQALKTKFKRITLLNYNYECHDPLCYPCLSGFFHKFNRMLKFSLQLLNGYNLFNYVLSLYTSSFIAINNVNEFSFITCMFFICFLMKCIINISMNFR